MADHSLFVFVRVQGATPEAVGNALKDGSDKILDIYSIMGEWDLLVRIEHPDLNEIQKVVTEFDPWQFQRSADLHRARLSDLRLEMAGLRLSRHRMTIDLEKEYNNRARVPENPGIMAGWASDSAAYRAQKPPRVVRYGDGERHNFDLFEAGDGPAVIYLHGGYWQALG